MLSTVTAAQLQFRVDTAEHARELSLRASIRDRRARLADLERAGFVARPVALTPAAAWPRPIGVQPACAA